MKGGDFSPPPLGGTERGRELEVKLGEGECVMKPEREKKCGASQETTTRPQGRKEAGRKIFNPGD